MGEGASRFPLVNEYSVDPGAEGDSSVISTSPSWALAVVRNGVPLTYSRRLRKGKGDVTDGGFARRKTPLVIQDDCIQLQISNSKRSHTKTLYATLRAYSGVNYLDRNALLPGDWLFAWCANSEEDIADVVKRVLAGEPVNGFRDGLKFVGRVHNIRKRVVPEPGGKKHVLYTLQGIGFEELDSQFFYDVHLATAIHGSAQDFPEFLASIGVDYTTFASAEQQRAGRIENNADNLITKLIDLIVGKGADSDVNLPTERGAPNLVIAPQANREAPFAYLVPHTVGSLLGKAPSEASKGSGLFGYADILETLVGVQLYYPDQEATASSFYPVIDIQRSSPSRKYSTIILKGTFLPVEPSFVNRPLWQVLQQFLNHAINEMFTSLRVNSDGVVVPTLVVRQFPFSTESIKATPDFQLTKFLSLPRWVIHPSMVTGAGLDIGRSNATRCNFMHVFGQASAMGSEGHSVGDQMTRNPPIYDQIDIQRSGIRGTMMTVNCALGDQLAAPRPWMEAMADWSFGSQYTLNGSVELYGLQVPVPEGDNVEFEGLAYHIESVNHSCGISADGKKMFRTHLELSNGMPIDQSDASDDFPRYPGFINHIAEHSETTVFESDGAADEVTTKDWTETTADLGDDEFADTQDPGVSFETILPHGDKE